VHGPAASAKAAAFATTATSSTRGFVEKVIAEHPQVDDVFVYGVPAASEAPGERDMIAAIVPVDAKIFEPASVFATCVKALEPNFVPSYLQVGLNLELDGHTKSFNRLRVPTLSSLSHITPQYVGASTIAPAKAAMRGFWLSRRRWWRSSPRSRAPLDVSGYPFLQLEIGFHGHSLRGPALLPLRTRRAPFRCSEDCSLLSTW
jgi:hypothetical protein